MGFISIWSFEEFERLSCNFREGGLEESANPYLVVTRSSVCHLASSTRSKMLRGLLNALEVFKITSKLLKEVAETGAFHSSCRFVTW